MTDTLYEQVWAWDNLLLAWQNASRGKRGLGPVAQFEFLLADNLLQIQAELQARTYTPGAYHSFYIHEPKRRLISAAPFRDRVVHHALCNITVPHFERLFIGDSYANREGKGTHRAVDRCQAFARRFQYVLPCDVVQFFPSIDHALLRERLSMMLPASQGVRWLIDQILDSGRGVLAEAYDMAWFAGDDLFAVNRPRGLPIGNLSSQWWANCYLNAIDQFVKRELGCAGYLRYVDDLLLFGDDPGALGRWRERLIERMGRYRLTIHAGGAQPRPVNEGIPFLGFTVFPTHRRLKRPKGIAFRRKLKRMLAMTRPDDPTVQATLGGWINHVRYADTWGLRRAVMADCGLLADIDVGQTRRPRYLAHG